MYANAVNPILCLASLCFCYGIYQAQAYLARLKIIRGKGCQPPPSLPQQDPFFSLDLVYQLLRSTKERRLNLTLKQQLDIYGNTFQCAPYGKARIFTIEHANLQAVWSSDFSSYGVAPLRHFPFEPLVGNGVMTTDGVFWEQSRELLRPMFARAQIADLNRFEVHVQKFLKLIPRDGSTIDLQPLFARLELDTSTEFIFGESLGSLTEDAKGDRIGFKAAFNTVQRGMGRRGQLPKWNFLHRDKQFWESCRIVRAFVDDAVDKAMAQRRSSEKKTKMSVLAYDLVEQRNDRVDIRNQLMNVFLPGHDTTAILLSNVFFHLARHPAVWTKLRTEIVHAEENVTFDSLKRLVYLQHVINETFRLNPPVGTMTRVALKDTVLPTGGGPNHKAPVFVRKGMVIATSFYALHRRKDIYGEDAEVFRPERWESLKPPPWSFMPFGGGPRVCPGQQLALAEATYAIFRMLREFGELENRDAVWEFVELYKLVTESRNGVKVGLRAA